MFAAAALDPEHETYIVHVVSFSSTPLVASLDSTPFDADVYPSRRPQISGLIAEEAPTKVSDEYINFADVFSLDLASKLLKYTGTKDHAIELVNANGFIRLSKSIVRAPR